MGFTKLDEDFFDSSLVAEGPIPTAVFVLLLAKAKSDGIARVAATVVGGRLGLSQEETARAFDVLQSPDPHSRSLEHDGRRIARVDGGWLILNYRKRREMGLREAVREYDRERKRAGRIPEDSGRFPESSASASPTSVVVGKGSGEGEVPAVPPADRAERAIRASTDALRTRLYALVSQAAEADPKHRDPTELMRLFTGYSKGDRQVGGVVNAHLLTHERLEKSIADAEWHLAEWEKHRGA